MARRHWMLGTAVVAVLGGCGSGASGPGDDLDRLRQQAHEALARYDQAVAAAGGQQRFVPVGDPTAQLGDWEPENGDNNKRALLAGLLVGGAALPSAAEPTGTVVWETGATLTLPLVGAGEALRPPGTMAGDCFGCVPLEATGARLTTARIETTRGPATAPVWEYTLKGTAVKVTRVAVAGSATVKVTPPSWDPYHAPGGLGIQSASTTRSGTQLTVTFTGAPEPKSRPCGADYTGEAVASANAVVVIVLTHQHSGGQACPAIGAWRTATIELVEPLGERAVLEVQQGLPVPLTITA